MSRADEANPLGVDDLEMLSNSAYLIGRDPDFYRFLDRHINHTIQTGEEERSARCAFWPGLNDIKAETIVETTAHKTGEDLWHWIISSNQIAEMILSECLEVQHFPDH